MSNPMMAVVVGKGVAKGRTPWAAEDVVLIALLPYALTLAVMLLCGPVMLVAWGVSEMVARVR